MSYLQNTFCDATIGMTDQSELLKRVLAHDRMAQKQLYEMHASKMLGVCYRYCGNRDDAEEVMQQAFVKVFMQIETFRNDGSLEGWIRKVMTNTALNFLKQKRKIEFDELENVSELISVNSDALENFDVKQLMHYVAQLPAGYRTVLNLYAIEGYSHKEIGQMLSITESTSRSQYTRAKKMLAEKIQLPSQYVKHE
ncbi:MAG: RNA polymerase sigma factor [Bacteroidia bacterium]